MVLPAFDDPNLLMRAQFQEGITLASIADLEVWAASGEAWIMGDKEILRSNQEGFKALHPLRILLVDEDAEFRASFAHRAAAELPATVETVASVPEAERAVLDRQFDLLLFGNEEWEAGTLLYLDLLNRNCRPCQFILFIEKGGEVPPQLRGLVRVMRKPDPDGSLDWLRA